MDEQAFSRAIGHLRRQHFLHYALQAALMAGLVLAAGRRLAGNGTENPKLATWPLLLAMLALLAIVGVLVQFVSGYIKPNPQRPAAENLRLYQGRVFLRDSLLGLAALPPLAAYALGGGGWNPVFFAVLVLVPCVVTAPSGAAYRRWLVS